MPHPAVRRAALETLESRLLFATGPTAGGFVASTPTITTTNSNPETLTIVYSDTVNISASTVAPNNISVSGPVAVNVAAGAAVPNTDGTAVTGDYVVNPPSGGWTSADNGTYTVKIVGGVADVNNNTVAANNSFATFAVNIPNSGAGPSATLTSAPTVTATTGNSENVVVTYSDPNSPIQVSSIATSNISVSGTNGPLQVTSVTASPSSNGSPITATYVVQKVGGANWRSADNGTYTIALNNNVTDAASNHTTANSSFGTFAVNVGATAGPTAALTTPTPITSATGNSENVIVTYSDAGSPIQISSIQTNNISVSGTNGPLQVTSVTASPNSNGSPITATYVVQKVGGGNWSSADNGTYTISLNNNVTDAAGNHTTANASFGTFAVNIGAVTGPQAVLTSPTAITTAGTTSENIIVTYSDSASPIAVSSITPANITVAGTGGPLTVTSVTTTPSTNASVVTATYVVQKPGGAAFTSADNGSYVIGLTATVMDAASNKVAANPNFGSFQVNIGASAGPTAALTAPTAITTAGALSEKIVITYTDSTSPIQVSSITTANITVTGTSGPLVVSSVTTTPTTNGSPITATYTVSKPGGAAFTAADNGTYTIGLTATVMDAASNKVAANPSLGTFTVNITAPIVPPMAALTPPASVTNPGQVIETIVVTYTDPTTPVKVSSITPTSITVTGPNNKPLTVLSVTTTPTTDANTITATYTVQAPSATGFGPADNGTYIIGLTAAVTDTAGHPVVANPAFGSFVVNIVSTTTPQATVLQDADLNTPGQIVKQIVIQYTDPLGIDPASVMVNNISVLAPDGTALLVTDAVTTSTTPQKVLTATYTVEKPATALVGSGSPFTAADNGTYTVNINPPPDSVANVGGTHAAVFPAISTFKVDIPDNQPPTATLTAPTVTQAGQATEVITAVLMDDVAVNTASINASDLVVTDSLGNQLKVQQVLGLPQPNAMTVTVQFVVSAPTGGFTNDTNGTYNVTLSNVTDTSGNVLEPVSTNFIVDIAALPGQGYPLGSFGTIAGQQRKLKFRDIPDGTVGTLTILGGSGQAFQEGSSNAIDLVLYDNGRGVNVQVGTANGRPVTINNVYVHGTLVNFSAPNANISGTFYVNGTVQKATFRHLVGTTTRDAVFAASGPINNLNITKATTHAMILSGANLGATGQLGAADDSFGPGFIGNLTLGGTLTTSIVAAGVNPGADGLFGTSDDVHAGNSVSIIRNVNTGQETGPETFFEAMQFGTFRIGRNRFVPNPATDPRFILVK